MSEIHIASETGDIEKVIALLEAGVDIESKDDIEDTPLRVAAAAGHLSIVKVLIDNGANVGAATEGEFYMALMGASANGHTEVVRLLLSNGADVNGEDDYNATALTAAAENGHVEVVRLLLALGADASIREERNMTALELAESCGHEEVASVLREQQKKKRRWFWQGAV